MHLQSTLGFEAAKAGAAFVPLYGIMLIGSPLAGQLADRIGARVPVVAGSVIFAAGAWRLSTLQPGSGYLTEILPGLLVLAVGSPPLAHPWSTTRSDNLEAC